ncbi:acid protease [Lactifluus volemus]|nr:acid protease [Lactifluus volemus]
MFPSNAFVLRVAAILFFTAFTAAKSIPISKRSLHSNRGELRVVDLGRNKHRTIQKMENGLKTYQKNTNKVHPLVGGIDLSRKRATGTVPLTSVKDEGLWYCLIEIGTPRQKFTVEVDTGSSDLFVPGNNCRSGCEGHARYDPDASSTSKNLHKSFSFVFRDNSTTYGHQFTDAVSISGIDAFPQALAAAINYSMQFNITNFRPDGLMGMGFQSISVLNEPPVFQTLVDQNAVDCPMFSFKLSTIPGKSELFLGGANLDLFIGDFTWVSLTHESFWLASFDSISVNGRVEIGPTAALFDTGTTLIIGDPSGIERFFKRVPNAKRAPEIGDGFYTIPCNFNTPISITVGGKVINISPASFNLGPVSSNNLNTCVAGAVSDAGLTGLFWFLGDVFLQNVYTAWDVGNGRIGFADLRV